LYILHIDPRWIGLLELAVVLHLFVDRSMGKFMKLSALAGITLALAAFSGTLCAQTVYKCTSRDGVRIFSSEPCGKDAKATTYQAPTADEEADRADANCRRAANGVSFRANEAGIEAAKTEIDALAKSTHTGTPGENEAWTRNTQARMASLQEYIHQEEARNAAEFRETQDKRMKAVADCEKQKTDRQSQLAREGGGAGSPTP
jgi:hypothetical protein